MWSAEGRIAVLGGVPHFDVVGGPEPLPEEETPVLRIYRQWEALQEAQDVAYDATRGQGMEIEDAVCESFAPARRAIEEAIQAEPATTLQDLAAKMIVLTGEGTWAPPDAVILECAALVGRDFDKLPRCLFTSHAAVA